MHNSLAISNINGRFRPPPPFHSAGGLHRRLPRSLPLVSPCGLHHLQAAPSLPRLRCCLARSRSSRPAGCTTCRLPRALPGLRCSDPRLFFIIAAERLTSKGAYVACSRGRKSCIVHTPDKARLIERLPEGNRRALDVLSETHSRNASILNRVKAWKQLCIDLAQHIGARINQTPADGIRIAPQQKRLSHRI
jgi:hypothetical protein